MDRGLRILGAVEHLLGSAGTVLAPQELRWWERDPRWRQPVGREAFQRLLEEGRSLSLGTALELVSSKDRGSSMGVDPTGAA